jgi:hypothetical protein
MGFAYKGCIYKGIHVQGNANTIDFAYKRMYIQGDAYTKECTYKKFLHTRECIYIQKNA